MSGDALIGISPGDPLSCGDVLKEASITVREITDDGVRADGRDADAVLGRLPDELLIDWVGERRVGEAAQCNGMRPKFVQTNAKGRTLSDSVGHVRQQAERKGCA